MKTRFKYLSGLVALLAIAVFAQQGTVPTPIPEPPEEGEIQIIEPVPVNPQVEPTPVPVPVPTVPPTANPNVTGPQFPAFPAPRTITRTNTVTRTNMVRPTGPAFPQIPAPGPAGATRTVPARGATTGPAPGVVAPPVMAAPGGAAAVPAPGAGADPIVPSESNFGALAPDAVLPVGTITRMQSMPLEQVFTIYALVTGRIILRPNQLPAAAITLDASQRELTKAEAIQALDSVLTLNGITMIPVGDKFVTAVPSNQAVQEAAQFTDLNSSDLPEAGQYITKIITLTNLLPSEVMPLIQGFGKTQNGIVPIDSSMTLVLRDYAANIKRMTEIIEKVDVRKEEDLKLEVIPIRYGRVEEIYQTMSSLIGGGGGGGAGVGAGTTGTMGARRTGSSSMGGRSSGFGRGGFGGGFGGMGGGYGGYGGSRYGGGYGSGYYPQQVATTPGQPTTVGSTTFQRNLQNVVSRMGGQQKEVQMLESAKIVPDERSNSLIVYANKKDMVMITNMVAKVDRLLAQVLIEAVIMEVKLTGDLELGVSAFLKDKSGSWTSEGAMNPGGILNTLTNLGGSSADGLRYLGRYNDDVTVVVKALSSNGRGEIIATPRIQTSHAMEASFTIGETVPYVSGTYSYGLGSTPSTSYTQLPVISELTVTPYITPDGLVVMEVYQIIQDIAGFKKFDGVGELPETVERSATATVSVQDQDTIILGGYVRNSRSRSKSGVPVLKDLPLFGAAFRSSSDKKSRSEMVIFLKPTVLAEPRDAALLATREQDRMPGLRRMNAEMNKEMDKLQEKVDRELGEKAIRPKTGDTGSEPANLIQNR